MKKMTQTGMLLLGLMVAFAGCDAAKEKLDDAKDLTNIDFGDFDMAGLQDQFSGITDGFKDVNADNVDGLTSKISGLTGSIDGMGIGNLTGPAKTAAGGVISKFIDAITSAMGGISDEGILSKLKPVVDPLLQKLNAFK
ncbi:MAG: hypothetical protein ACR2NP_23240 [Pirellulaceae bacterium]